MGNLGNHRAHEQATRSKCSTTFAGFDYVFAQSTQIRSNTISGATIFEACGYWGLDLPAKCKLNDPGKLPTSRPRGR